MHSKETAQDNWEEGDDDVKSVRPLCLGLHTCYNGRYKELSETARWSKFQKADLSSDCRLQFAYMKPESLVSADQQCCAEYVPGS